MYYKLNTEAKRVKRGAFKDNPIYLIVYEPLWRMRGDNLSPEEVWIEGNNLAAEFKENYQKEIEIRVREAFEDLCERYSIFQDESGNQIRRTFLQAEKSAMMVSTVAFFLLLNVYPNIDNHPYAGICHAIGDVIGDIVGFKGLYEEIRQEEDKKEAQGSFIEVADFIEQIAIQEEPLSEKQLTKARFMFGQFVEEHKYCDLPTMYTNERMIARVNDKNDHCLQAELDMLRKQIKELEGNDSERLDYKNVVFAKEYEEKIADIRKAILPFVEGGPYHIDKSRKNQWLAIIEPLKLIDGLLITHEERPKNKECTDGEICDQLKEFFSDIVKTLDFDKIPKSISAERTQWKERGIGLTLSDWNNYLNSPRSETKYKALADIAKRVYGEVVKVIRR